MKYTVLVLSIMIVMQTAVLSAENRGLSFTPIKTQSGEEVGLYKESHALVIGVSDYTAGWPNLPGVKKDVQAVKTELEKQGFQMTVVENPTRAALDQAFTDFINKYGQEPDNRLLFYFSGHGHTVKLSYGEEMGYIVPADTPNPNTDQNGFIAKALDMQMIEVYAKRIQSKHALFLFDSCFSGSIFSLSRAAPESITYKTAQPVRQFMTSGSAEEQVPDESVFRQQFIAALDGEGDLNSDGYVTGAELGEFLQEKVVNYSKGSQHPQYGKIRNPNLDKGDFVFQLPGTASASKQQETATTAAEKPQETTARTVQTSDPETEMWELIKDSQNISDVKDFLAAFPDGKFAKVAQLKLKQLEREASDQQAKSTQERAITSQERVQSPEPPETTKEAPVVDKDAIQAKISEMLRETDKSLKGKMPSEPGSADQMSPFLMPALGAVHERLGVLKYDLGRLAEERNAKRFEVDATVLTATAIKKMEKALDIPDNEHAQQMLATIHTLLPDQIEGFVLLAKVGKWSDLQADMEQRFQEITRKLEEQAIGPAGEPGTTAESGMSPETPANERNLSPAIEAILSVREHILILKNRLARLTAERDTQNFEPVAVALRDTVLAYIDQALVIMEPSSHYARAKDVLKTIQTTLPKRIEGFVKLADEGKWEVLRAELDKSLPDLVRAIEEKALDGKPIPKRPILQRPLQEPDRKRK